jgi:predicted amidohydrolase
VTDPGRRLDVALLQLRAFELADHEAAWAELLRRIDEAAEPPAGRPRPRLIVAPEASYPAYYLHSRADYDAAGVLPDAEVEAVLGERAAGHGVAIAAGLVQRDPDGGLRNAAVLFAPSGEVVARSAKRFLWHFDGQWFSPGEGSPVVEVGTEHGVGGVRCGLFICADGRLPEIPRALAAAGAELLIDPTAWVSSGRDAAALSNPQVDYMLAARAIENGAWIVAADKVGTEAGTVVYAGRSGVVDPSGRWRVQAPSDEAGVVRYAIDLDEARGAPVPRRPELYEGAAVPGGASRAAELAREPLAAEDGVLRVAAAALEASPSAVKLMEQARSLARTLATQDAELLVLPDLARADPHALSPRELLPLLEALSAETGLMLAVTLAERPGAADGEPQRSYKTLYVLDRGALLGAYRQTHLDEAEREAGFTPGDEPPPVLETRLGALGVLAGRDALAPELARALKLGGAELIAWCGSPLPGAAGEAVRALARTRAAENRVYLVAAAGADPSGGAYVVEPSGSVAAESLAGEPMAVAADANRALARWHRMAPHTDPILAHHPEAFPELYGAPASPQQVVAPTPTQPGAPPGRSTADGVALGD